MNELLVSSIKDTFDDVMRDYINSPEYLDERWQVNTMFLNLRKELSPDQATRLNDILNATDNSNNELALEAYARGVILGMSVHDKFSDLI